MSFGKGGSTTYTTPELTPEQRQQIDLQNQFAQYLIPSYKSLVGGEQDLYNASIPGVTQAGQNLAQTANQAQNILGTTGESALNTGISGLENVFSPDYEQQQLAAAMAPAEAQYAQNIAQQGAQFGGAGETGSARQALAQQQTAGATQAAQMQAAAQVENQIAQQRLATGQALTGAGQQNLGQALGAAQTGVTAAMTPQQLYNQYAAVLYGTPASSYNLGPYGQSQTSTKSSFGINI